MPLAQLVGEALHLVDVAERGVQLSLLDPLAGQAAQRLQRRQLVAGLVAERQGLEVQRQPLVQIVQRQVGGARVAQHRGQRRAIVQGPGQRHRLARERDRLVDVRRRLARGGQARHQAGPQRRARGRAGQRLFQHADQRGIDEGEGKLGAAAERDPPEQLGVAEGARQRGRLIAGGRGPRPLAGALVRFRHYQQQLGAGARRRRVVAGGQRLQRVLEMPGRLLVGVGGQRALAGGARVADGAGRIAAHPGAPEVVGQLGEAIGIAGGARRLQRPGHRGVQPGPLGGAQVLVDRLADQDVVEAVARAAVQRRDQPGLLGLGQRGGQVGRRVAVRRLQQAQRELAPDDGRHPQRGARRVRDARQVAADRGLHAVGDQHPVHQPLAGAQAVRDDQPHHLVHEQRRPLGRLHDGVDQRRRRRRAPDAPASRAATSSWRRRRSGKRCALALDLGQQRRRLGAEARVGVAVGPDDQDAGAAQAAGDEREQAQRRAIGDVQIVEHQQQRRARGGRAQEAPDGVVEREAGGLRGGAGGVGGQAGEPGAQLGEQRRQRGRPGAQRGGQPGRLLLLDQRAQHLYPGPVGGRALGLPAAPPQDAHVGGGAGGQLVGQAGLADPGLADQQEEASVAGARVGERALQRPQLRVAAQQRRHRRSLRRRGGRCPRAWSLLVDPLAREHRLAPQRADVLPGQLLRALEGERQRLVERLAVLGGAVFQGQHVVGERPLVVVARRRRC